jgi:glycosyltransferase involved in cell wall biosynthesis
MHIRLLIANAYVGGGTARTISSTASALVRRGHDVEVVSLLRRRREPTFPMDPRVRLYPLVDEFLRDREDPPRHALERAGRVVRGVANAQPSVAGHVLDRRTAEWSLYTDAVLIRWLRAQRGGVIVGTRPALNLAVARFARRSIVRVGQDHMNLGSYKPALRRSLRRWYPRGLDALVTLTERDADQYAALLGGRTRVLSIPNGVPDVGGHRATLDAKLVVAAGRLTPQKGYDRLLPVWKDVVAQRPDWRLQIYGGGAKEDALRAQIAQLGIGDSAQLMGRSDELFARMAEASLFVMTSRKEGLPMVLLEAMGIGLPVVAYDCPTGPREVISDGVDGYIVRNGDRKALAARMIQLMDDADERRRLGQAGLEKAARFDLDHLAARWERLFGELAEAKRD